MESSPFYTIANFSCCLNNNDRMEVFTNGLLLGKQNLDNDSESLSFLLNEDDRVAQVVLTLGDNISLVRFLVYDLIAKGVSLERIFQLPSDDRVHELVEIVLQLKELSPDGLLVSSLIHIFSKRL